jgi:hypothetical protein
MRAASTTRKELSMRRLSTTVVAVVVSLGIASIAAAGNVLRISQIDVSHHEPILKGFLSEYCGFDVYVQGEGFLDVTVHFDREGRVVRESYSSAGAFVTYSSPLSGSSYRFPWLPREEFVYPGGAVIGGPAIYRIVGMHVNHAGLPPEAGLLSIRGTVVAFAPDGPPIVEFTDADFEAAVARGRSNTGNETDDATCKALAG